MIYRCFVLLCLLHLVTSELATLTEHPGYATQRPCAKDCFYYGAFKGPDNLAQAMGCQMSNAQNECICRSDLQVSGERYVRSCVNSKCANANDISVATSIYNMYCTSAGFTRDAAVTSSVSSTSAKSSTLSSSPTSQPSTSNPASSEPSIRTSAPANTSAAQIPAQTSPPSSVVNNGRDGSSTGSGKSDGKLGTGEIIGIVVGVLGFFATAVGAFFSYKALKVKRQQHSERQMDYAIR